MVLSAIAIAIAIFRTIIQMPLDVFPTFAPPQVEIQTEAPGLAPEEVESLVTLPIESAIGDLYRFVDRECAGSVGRREYFRADGVGLFGSGAGFECGGFDGYACFACDFIALWFFTRAGAVGGEIF